MEGLVTAAVNPDFWRARRVLVTGHTGFKGSWLCLWLQSMGAHVSGYALAPGDPALFTLASIGKSMESTTGDVVDQAALNAAFDRARPEVVFHLAAQSLVRASYEEPMSTYMTNVMGTVNVLEACRHSADLAAVVVVTSDKCYENKGLLRGYVEGDELGGHDPYSSSKACAEMLTAAWRQSFFGGGAGGSRALLATVRAGNVIGGGDWARDRLVPDALAAFGAGQVLQVRNPHAVRPWQHVLEPLAGYLLLAERLCGANGTHLAGPWNFGPAPDDTRPVSWIASRLTELWGCNASWQADPGMHVHEAHHLALDSTKARNQLSWAPRWNLDTALAAIIEWHRAWRDGADLREITLTQIRRHSAS